MKTPHGSLPASPASSPIPSPLPPLLLLVGAFMPTAVASPYRDAVLEDAPLAYYRFEETGGAAAVDASGGDWHGTYLNEEALGFGVASAEPNLGTAVDFGGGYLELPNLGVFAQCSVEFWIQYDTNEDPCCSAILASDDWAPGALHLNLAAAGDRLEHAVNGDAIIRGTDSLSSGRWYHVVITSDVDLDETKFYLDGVLVGDDGDQTVREVVLGNSGLQLGAWNGTRLFDGRLDEFAIYDSVLDSGRVAAHFAAATAPPTPDIRSFTVSPGGPAAFDTGIALPADGGTVVLAWDVASAETVTIDNGALAETAAGSGSVEIAVTADTRFTLTAANAEGTSTAVLDVLVDPMAVDPVLSEFMAENDGSLRDGHGATSDWIELFNRNGFARDLAGFRLTDGATVWAFPAGSYIPASGHLVVFASGNGTADPEGHLHASFSLDRRGEYLALERSDGSVVDAFAPAFPPQFADVSFGRHGDPARDGFFVDPTPGEANGTGFEGLLDKSDDTSFAMGRGFYEAPFDETITAETPGASIIYTLDGTTPSESNGTRVDAPDAGTPPSAVVRIDGSTDVGVTTLRAAVFKEGFVPTNVDTQTYVFSGDVPFQSEGSAFTAGWPPAPVNGQQFDFGMTLDWIAPGGGSYTPEEVAASLESIPTLSLVTDPENLTGSATGIYVNALNRGRAWERPVSVELILPDGHVDPDGMGDGFQIDAGLRIRGGWSRRPEFLKHGFRLFFRGEYGDAKLEYPLFGAEGVEEFDKVDLRSSSNFDWARESDFALGSQFTFVREVFCRDTQGAMGQPYTKSRYYHLYLNGTYWGIYQTEERPEAAFGASYFGGDKDDFDTVKSSNHVGGFTTEATDGTLDAFEDLWNRVRAIGRGEGSTADFLALEGRGADGVRDPELPVLLDVDNLIDYLLVIFWSGDGDAVLSGFLENNRANNWFGIRNRNGDEGFRFFVHDAEHTLGTTNSWEDRTGPFTGSNQDRFLYANPQWMHQDLMASPDYRLRFADRVRRHFFRAGALTEEACIARFLRRAAQVEPALPAYAARWADARYLPSYHVGLWEDEIDRVVEDWIPGRTEVVLDQLREDGLYPDFDPPTFVDESGNPVDGGEVAEGFRLVLRDEAGPAGTTIYYTLDGSDPRPVGEPVRTITATLVDYDDERAWRVPVSSDDGFAPPEALGVEPIAYFPFDVDASDAADADGAQDGTLLNGASITADAHTGSGALLLDGVDDYVLLGDPFELRIVGEITMAAWVKANGVPRETFGNILAKGHWFDPNSEIFLRYAAQIDSWRVASWDGVVHGTEVPGAAADIGQWVHLVGTYDGTRWNLYRNGILASSTEDPVGAIDVPSDWAIGARGTGTERFFDGLIDEVYLFDTALDAEEVAALYSGSVPVWQDPGYGPAASWIRGPGGHGYDEPGGPLEPLIGTDVGAAMKDRSGSLLTRATFTIAPGALDGADYLEMNVAWDAGFVAYLNGVEVHRSNAPAGLAADSVATAARAVPGELVTIDLSAALPLLVEGANVLAVHSLNDSIGSANHLIRCRLRLGTTPAVLSPGAVAYEGPIAIDGPTLVRTRVFRDGEWSALDELVLHTGAVPADDGNLVISQIHYHPVAEPGDPHPAGDHEFLEVMNIGARTVDLGGLRLRDDVSFDFPEGTFLEPGERAQVVADTAAFDSRHGGRPVRVLGEFSGNLANEGGRLVLSSDIAGTIRDFAFDDDAPWPTGADGEGFALTLIAPESNPDHADPANWRRSVETHGSPGASDAMDFTGDPEADDDGDGLPALLEYALGSSDAEPTANPWRPAGPGGAVSIERRLNADDIVWIPETSDDLLTWTSDPGSYVLESGPGSDSTTVLEVYREAGPSMAGRRYFRIRVVRR